MHHSWSGWARFTFRLAPNTACITPCNTRGGGVIDYAPGICFVMPWARRGRQIVHNIITMALAANRSNRTELGENKCISQN